MDNDVIGTPTDETKSKLRDFDEQEAYFLLCQIFSYAQATKDYARFQNDLNQWKKRFPIDLFSENLKNKIKYMLSNEFLDTVLKNFMAFDELSRKDPQKGLDKLRKIYASAEKHKNAKTLDKDLDDLYKEYPLKFLKEKYPHIVGVILSKANRERVLQKFDFSDAFRELDAIVAHPDKFRDAKEFTDTIAEWQKTFPVADFKPDYQDKVQKTLDNFLDNKKLAELFPVFDDLDLNNGTVISLELQSSIKNFSAVCKDALHDFFKIVDRNKGDINNLFDWLCRYSPYINDFDSTTKTAIVNNLMSKYAYELPPLGSHYQIPKMDSGAGKLLSLSDFNSIDDTKKESVLQMLGILSTGKSLTSEDIYRLRIINSNVQKVKMIEKAKIEPKLEIFMDKFPEEKLTPNDSIYLESNSDTRVDISIANDVDLTLHNDDNDNLVEEDEQIHTDEPDSFRKSLEVKQVLEKVNYKSDSTSSSDSGSSAGGSGLSTIKAVVIETEEAVIEKECEQEKEKKETSVLQDPIFQKQETKTATILEPIPANDDTEVIANNSEIRTDIEEKTAPTFRERIINKFKFKATSGNDRDDR